MLIVCGNQHEKQSLCNIFHKVSAYWYAMELH